MTNYESYTKYPRRTDELSSEMLTIGTVRSVGSNQGRDTIALREIWNAIVVRTANALLIKKP